MDKPKTTERYFECIRARDLDGLLALYADDARFTLPNGQTFAGKEAIREMHGRVFASGAPFPTPVAAIANETAAAIEIEARLPDGTTRNTANFFYLDDMGRIERVSVYTRTG